MTCIDATPTTSVPCRSACPVGTHGGGYAALLGEGDVEAAYYLLRRCNPLAGVCGHVCPRPCEKACRRSVLDAPLELGRLARYLEGTQTASAETFERILARVERPRPPAVRGGRVAVVGAGPAGLACAHDLRLLGHEVTLYERRQAAGGLVRYGLPAFRVPRSVLEREIAFILWLGVELRLGQRLGRELALERLLAEHDAVFLALGCADARPPVLPGAELPGVLSGVELMALVAEGQLPALESPVIVVGETQAACDVARTAVRLLAAHGGSGGASSLARRPGAQLVWRGSCGGGATVELVAAPEEALLREGIPDLLLAEEEGVRLLGQRQVVGVFEAGGRVAGVSTVALAGAGAVALMRGRGGLALQSEFPAGTVVFADGRRPELACLGGLLGWVAGQGDRLRVDPVTGATGHPGLYAGGELAHGPRTVVAAVADGRRAALAIDSQITGRRDVRSSAEVVTEVLELGEELRGTEERGGPALDLPRRRPVAERTLASEVEPAFDAERARAEGRRCLRCWINATFQASALAGTECLHCGGCVEICPQSCIDLGVLRRRALAATEPWLDLPARGAQAAGVGEAEIPRKDDGPCIRCGLCVMRCPVGVVRLRVSCGRGEWDLLAQLQPHGQRSGTWH